MVTRHNVTQLDQLKALADGYGAQLRLTRFRPSGRGADSWDALHPTAADQRLLYRWLLDRPDVLTGDSFFHLSALGEPLDGLNLCGAGRVVCLIDPVGDVYACPFVIHDEFLAGNVRDVGGFTSVWRESELFTELRQPQSAGACASCGSYDACRGGCMAAKFYTGLPLDGPDPECVFGHGEEALAGLAAGAAAVPHPGNRPLQGGPPRGARAGPHAGAAAAGRPALTGEPDPVTGGGGPGLGSRRWPDVAATGGRAVLVLPVGSLEQHGPHLPLDTDTRIATALAEALASRRAGVLVAPPLPFGASGEHADFAGTLSVDHAVVASAVVELVRSARRSFAGVVVVSGHGGNAPALARAAARAGSRATSAGLVARRSPVATPTPAAPRPALAAGPRPGGGRPGRPRPAADEPLADLLPGAPGRGVRAVSPNGVLGDPTGATADEGRAGSWSGLTDDLVARVDRWWPGRAAPVRTAERARPVEPGGRGHRGRPGHRGGHRRPAGGRRGWRVVAVDSADDDPELGYAIGRPAELEAVAAAHPDQVVAVAGRRAAAGPTGVRGGPWPQAVRPLGRRRGRGRRACPAARRCGR